MKTALADGAQVDHRDIFNGPSTCLHLAACYNHLDATKLLLEEGANVDAVTGVEQWTPMMLASQNNQPEIVKLLLEYNGRTDLKDKRGSTALHQAALYLRLPVVQVLVGKSNVNARDKEGKTPLGLAEERGWGKYGDAVIQCLKQHGATL